jgi:RND family efflux transporter MFP subunit
MQIDSSSKKHLAKPVIIIIGILVVLFIIGLIPKIGQIIELKKMHEETTGAIPVVHVVNAKPAPTTESMVLPGNISAIQYATLFARVDGYLTKRMVDIGDRVKAGQLLAVIATPEIDEQLNQSKADLAEARAGLQKAQADLKEAIAQQISAEADVEKTKANLNYATVTAKRWQSMCTRGAVSEQSRDEKVRALEAQTAELAASQANEKALEAKVVAAQYQVKVAKATVVAREANVKKYQAQQGFQNVTAPFDGVITERKVDPGALITAGSSTSNLELFQMAKIDVLRIYVSVPQRFARYLKAGMQADILVPEFPDQVFPGIITNVSGALDPNSRTLQTEIHIKNKDEVLLPGMYAQVKITGLRDYPCIQVPGTTIVTKSDGQYVVIIKDNKAHYQAIDIGRDFGNDVEIKTGLAANDVVVISPSDDLLEGEPVEPVKITEP